MNDELRAQLVALELNEEQINAIGEKLGVASASDMAFVEVGDLTSIGILPVPARKIVAKYAPAPTAAATPAASATDTVIPEGKQPSPNQVNGFASQLGIDPSMFSMFMFANAAGGAGMDMDISTFLPVGQIVTNYNPKLRNMSYMVMGQIERRLGGNPIIVINANGSVNAAETANYVSQLEEGFEPAPDNIYYDGEGQPYELIKVGVDAQSIYDADPLQPNQALQKNGMGVGRIKWHDSSLEVRQVMFYAAQLGEVTVNDEGKLSWLREHINATTTRLELRGEFPKAIAAYNEAFRTGALPTLRVQLSKTARRPETMPRRRAKTGGALGDSDARFQWERNDQD